MRLFNSAFIMIILLSLITVSCSSASPKISATLRIDFKSATSPMMKTDYSRIDSHALAAAKSDEKNIKSLAKYLSSAAQTDAQKARAMFIWLTDKIAYDADSFRRGGYGDSSPRGVLKNRKAVCQGYAELFNALAAQMGLESYIVSGYAKGYGYRVGENMSTNHAWNAVKINGIWRLVDATWGAGSVDHNYKFAKKLQAYYFFPSPSDLIFTHFPEDNRWQLLDRSLTAAEFAPMVALRPDAFALGIRPLSHLGGYIEAEDSLTITFKTSDGLQFLPSLARKNKSIDNKYITTSTEEGISSVNVTFPKKGEYELTIFATNPLLSSTTNTDGSVTTSFAWVGSYTIRAE